MLNLINDFLCTIMFDQKTINALGHYVYMLIDPRNDRPFYVGKGNKNRVFDHVIAAQTHINISTDKYDTIREIIDAGEVIKHVIVYHGLKSEEEAFRIECVLIDTLNYCFGNLTNAVLGHGSSQLGIMTTDEIKQLYAAQPLNAIANNCVIININANYNRRMGAAAIYQATQECWRMNAKRLKNIKYVLAEYRGLIVEVFEVRENGWYPIKCHYTSGKNIGKECKRWGFKGSVALDNIRNLYINKSVAHLKKKGQANPVTYGDTLIAKRNLIEVANPSTKQSARSHRTPSNSPSDIINKYKNNSQGSLGDFIRKCQSSAKLEKDGLSIPMNEIDYNL